MASCRNTLGARLCQDWPVTRVVRPFRGVSADERRDLRRSQLLEACLEIAGTAGMAAATVEAVSRQAGLSKRYFYESFRARDELFVALARSLLAEITGGVLDSMANSGSELIDRARMGIGRVITVLTDDPRKARVFTELVGSEMLNDTVGGAEHELAELLTALLLAGTQSDERQYHRLRLATLVIVAGTTKAVTSWLDGKLTVSRDDLIDEIAQMSVAAARTVRSDL
ncbi:MAG: TetR family transcriptional regulator [Mycobacterium sp.]|nr:MAG: TetR family transcriptional regulator [Mycobacterium sp.]